MGSPVLRSPLFVARILSLKTRRLNFCLFSWISFLFFFFFFFFSFFDLNIVYFKLTMIIQSYITCTQKIGLDVCLIHVFYMSTEKTNKYSLNQYDGRRFWLCNNHNDFKKNSKPNYFLSSNLLHY